MADEFINQQTEGQEAAQELPETQETQEPQEPPEGRGEPDTRLDEILGAAKEANARLEGLLEAFERRVAHTDLEEKVIDRMHAELQKYKEDMYAQLVRPILQDVIEVRDSIQRVAGAYLARPEGERSIPNKTFSDYAYDLQDILEKNQVEVYRGQPGDSFTPVRQRVLKKVKTEEESLHGLLAESLSSGYAYQGRVLSPEKIAVYFYEKPAEEQAAQEEGRLIAEPVPECEDMDKTEKSEENSNG